MMQDDGEIGPHIDYQGRIDQSAATNSSGNHGDHVGGTVMGAGNLDPNGKGMAHGAFLYVYGSSNNNYYSVPGIYQNNDVALKVIKGKVESDDSMLAYKVDGLSGATLTSRGVSNMIEYWFSESGYSSMLKELDYES